LAVVGHAEVIVRAITTGVKRDIQNSFEGLSGIGRNAGRQLGNALTRGIVGADPGKNAFTKMQQNLRDIYPDAEQAAEGFTSLMRTSFTLQGVIGAVVGSLSSLVSGLVSLAGAAIGAASSLAAVLPVFVAFGVATLGARLALGGIGEALNESAGAAARNATNLKRLEDSERRLANTVRQANERIQNSKERVTKAQSNLTKALEAGREELQQLGFDAEDAALAEKRAALELERARETLVRVQDLPPNSRARRDAELAFAEADLNLRKSIDRNADLRKEQDRLAKEGVEGLENVKDARESVTDAEEDLEDAVKDGTRAIEDATRAHKELKQEVAGGAGALGGMQSAYDKLTPSQKTFVDFLKELKPLMAVLKESVAKGFLPDLEEAIKRVVTSSFPTVNKGLAEIGDALGDASLTFSEAFEDQTNLDLLSEFFTNNAITIEKFGEFAKTAFGAILGFLKVIDPLAQKFLDWVIESTQKFEAFLKTPEGNSSMTRFFEDAGIMAGRFGTIFGNIFGGLGKIVEDSFKPGSGADKLLVWFEKATASFANMDTGKLNNTLSGAADNAIIILDALTGIFTIFMDLADDEGIMTFWSNLELSSKAFSDLLTEAVKVSGSFGALLSTLIQIAAVFADSGQAVAFFETLDFIAGGFLNIFEALKPFFDAIGPYVGAISAVAFVVGGLGTAVLITTGFASKALGIFGALGGIFTGAGVGGAAAATGTGLFATALRTLAVANPIGLAITGIVVAVTALAAVFEGFKADKLQKASLEVSAAFRDGASGADAWSAATENATDFGRKFDEASKKQYSSIKNIKDIMDKAAVAKEAFSKGGYSTTKFAGDLQALTAVKEGFQAYGKSLSNLATTDMPAAQEQFKKFRDESKLGDDQLIELIDSSEEYKNALIKQAEQYGINVIGADGLLKKQDLLNFALGTGEVAQRKLKEEMQKATDAQADYIKGMADSAVANSGFKDSLKDAFTDGEFSSKKFFKNMQERAENAVKLVAVKTSLLARGATTEMLDMVDAAGENALEVGRKLLKSNETDWNKWKTQTTQIAFVQSKEFADALAARQPLIANVFTRMGTDARDKFTAELSKASTLTQFDQIAKQWESRLNIRPSVSLQNKTGLTADAMERLIIRGAFKDGGLVGKLQKFASGGFVSGPGGPRSDSIMARLSDGEFVVNSASTSKWLPLLQAINSGSLSASRSGTGATSGLPATASAGASGSMSPTVNIVVNPSAGMNERDLATKISKVLALQLRKGSVT
jgi:hypothetical protein